MTLLQVAKFFLQQINNHQGQYSKTERVKGMAVYLQIMCNYNPANGGNSLFHASLTPRASTCAYMQDPIEPLPKKSEVHEINQKFANWRARS